MIRTSSNRYKEWLAEVFEGAYSEKYKRKNNDVERANYQQGPITEKTTVFTPRAIQTKGGVIELNSQENRGVEKLPMETTITHFESSNSDSRALTANDVNNSCVALPLSLNDVTPSIFLLTKPPIIDQTGLDPEVVVREGIDMAMEEMENQLAFIPELPQQEPFDIEKIDFGEIGQSIEEREQMKSVLSKYSKFFIQSENGLPPAARGAVCDIDVGDAKPIAQRARRVRHEHMEKLFDLLKGLLNFGLIKYSSSRWASPIVIVLKKGGKDIRLCIDYRCIIELQPLMLSPMRTLDSLLSGFHAVEWLLSLDNASGFWGILSGPVWVKD
ncbi:hypothetical protein AeMF1_007829 [Aphanomyces euteiches]|nr:hypothetical protein AeMF1_021425 [Aphanomyces euteiches]KAH9103020.1 hypothetical protein AeMF1_020532 [Aphanomyces euteiches]KAH9118401.1 hypothetical protein AeMF1_008426 [Aphanomyces euteiches]KAH9119531.1 hypothetical protein AeMF1_007829 [Aphanomyces euteiches]